MRVSTKCSIAIHILIVLEVFREEKLTSEILAKSTGCNPVVVRNVLGNLKKAGIVGVRRGTGGAFLTAAPQDINMAAVFEAVDPVSLEELMGLHPAPSQKCPVGKNIRALLEKPRLLVADSIRNALRSYTLQQILEDYYKLNQMEEKHKVSDN